MLGQTAYVYPYGGVGVFKDFFGIEFSINQLHNYGAAWGLFRDYPIVLIVVRLFIFAGLTMYLFFNKESCSLFSFALILVLSGALGNIMDFFLYGYVVDMFHFVLWGYDYPIFNVADSLVCVGVALLFISSFKQSKRIS